MSGFGLKITFIIYEHDIPDTLNNTISFGVHHTKLAFLGRHQDALDILTENL